jgi:hypothetical protein
MSMQNLPLNWMELGRQSTHTATSCWAACEIKEKTQGRSKSLLAIVCAVGLSHFGFREKHVISLGLAW